MEHFLCVRHWSIYLTSVFQVILTTHKIHTIIASIFIDEKIRISSGIFSNMHLVEGMAKPQYNRACRMGVRFQNILQLKQAGGLGDQSQRRQAQSNEHSSR